MLHDLYEWRLGRNLEIVPKSICFMLTDEDVRSSPDHLVQVTRWCAEYGIGAVTFHISTDAPESVRDYLPHIRKIGTIAHLSLHTETGVEEIGSGMPVQVVLGLSGREEIAACVKQMAKNGVKPDEVDEHLLESYLTWQYEPDLVIKTGSAQLTDFLIWQSVYSELFFSDVNWKSFRKTEFLRALRDFQERTRRFGA